MTFPFTDVLSMNLQRVRERITAACTRAGSSPDEVTLIAVTKYAELDWVRGLIEPVSDAEADAYFQSRDRGARIGAWASAQSRPLENRMALEKRIGEYTLKFGLGEIPRPPHWRGWRVAPLALEFWRDRPFRLHDRLVFERTNPAHPWSKHRLYP